MSRISLSRLWGVKSEEQEDPQDTARALHRRCQETFRELIQDQHILYNSLVRVDETGTKVAAKVRINQRADGRQFLFRDADATTPVVSIEIDAEKKRVVYRDTEGYKAEGPLDECFEDFIAHARAAIGRHAELFVGQEA